MPRKPVEKSTYRLTAVERVEPDIDPLTGEVRHALDIQVPYDEPGPFRGRPPRGATRKRMTRGRSRKVSTGYAMVDTESMGMLDLSRQEYRVFSFLMSKADTGTGEIRVTNTYIVRGTGMTANNVSKTMKLLRERNIIIAEGYGVWRFNSNILWVGEWKKWGKAAADDPEPIWSVEDGPNLEVVE